jgi:RNA polymerase sigma factor (sigma-70 family)
MASGQSASVVRQVQALFDSGPVAGLTDRQLLERFLTRHGEVAEAAFEALVARHGPMVLGVCRRLLADAHDVEDAFQATFLVLVRRADAVRVEDSLGRWLYGVSRRVALRARGRASRRPCRAAAAEPAAGPPCPADVAAGRDLRAALEEELERLPEPYRATVVLCDLEGLGHEEAAGRLGCPVGTIKSRLSRARQRLRRRLTRRGLAPSVGLGGALLGVETASAAVPAALAEATVRAALAVAAGRGTTIAAAAALAEEVGRSLALARWKPIAAVVLALGALGAGAALVPGEPRPPAAADPGAAAVPAGPQDEADAPRARKLVFAQAEPKEGEGQGLEFAIIDDQAAIIERAQAATVRRAVDEARLESARDEVARLEARVADQKYQLRRAEAELERARTRVTDLERRTSRTGVAPAAEPKATDVPPEPDHRLKEIERKLDQLLDALGGPGRRPRH